MKIPIVAIAFTTNVNAIVLVIKHILHVLYKTILIKQERKKTHTLEQLVNSVIHHPPSGKVLMETAITHNVCYYLHFSSKSNDTALIKKMQDTSFETVLEDQFIVMHHPSAKYVTQLHQVQEG